MKRVLLTGAAGGLGRVLRRELRSEEWILRLADREPLGEAQGREEHAVFDLADERAFLGAMKDVDAVVHLGGISTENTFQNILAANIVGVHNLYEAARKQRVSRVVFASSNHVIGFYDRRERLDADTPLRPDSIYGVSKGFGETLGRYYWDKYGIETVCIRIGSSFPEPQDRRQLATWLSHRDLCQLVRRSILCPRVGFTVVYGVSDNDECWWDNSAAGFLGWHPVDNAEAFRERVEARTPPADANDPALRYQGGTFATAGPFEEEEGA